MSQSLSESPTPSSPWLREEIEKRLPHRPPFLLLSQVDHISAWGECLAWNRVSPRDGVFAGHFPQNPVYPGVLILESLAQASAVLLQFSQGRPFDTCYLARCDQARFSKPVLPGDEVRLDVEFIKKRPPFFWSHGKASVAGTVVVQARMTAYITYA